jgi:hypothetical protein
MKWGLSDVQRRYLRRVYRIDPSTLEKSFTVALLAFFIYFAYLTRDFEPESRIFPLVVSIPAILFLSIVLLHQVSGSLEAWTGERLGDEFVDSLGIETLSETSSEDRVKLTIVVLWVFSFAVFIFLLGFQIGILLFLLSFYKLYAEFGTLETIVFSLVIWAICMALFDYVLKIRLFEGVIGVSII